mmetsp:Transcript_90561/g.210685  ORF Transcript_90561/g.210685 Transcript_90561/m.210685 type:complete len:281 (+) Transcript_90561:377-1219(+)
MAEESPTNPVAHLREHAATAAPRRGSIASLGRRHAAAASARPVSPLTEEALAVCVWTEHATPAGEEAATAARALPLRFLAEEAAALPAHFPDDAAAVVRFQFFTEEILKSAGHQQLELSLYVQHEGRELFDEDAVFMHELRDIQCLGCTSQAQAPQEELLNLDRVALLGVQQLEKCPRIMDVELQRGEVCLDLWIAYLCLQLLNGDETRVVAVNVLEEVLDLLDMLLLVRNDCLHGHILVALGALNGTLAEHTCDNIQHGKDCKGDEDEENRTEQPMHSA